LVSHDRRQSFQQRLRVPYDQDDVRARIDSRKFVHANVFRLTMLNKYNSMIDDERDKPSDRP
jgi:hypothetical protein